jgi:hypothetical protein
LEPLHFLIWWERCFYDYHDNTKICHANRQNARKAELEASMKKRRISKLLACMLVMAIIAACGHSGTESNSEKFDYDLRGIWESNDKSVYSGTLYIDYNYITITGYEENQTPQQGNDSFRPFKDFTKSIALKGYSEESKIFINDAGTLQEGIPYNYYRTDYKTEEFLRFNFGGRVEILQKVKIGKFKQI